MNGGWVYSSVKYMECQMGQNFCALKYPLASHLSPNTLLGNRLASSMYKQHTSTQLAENLELKVWAVLETQMLPRVSAV